MIRKAKTTEIEEIVAITRACAAKMLTENIFQWNEHYPTKAASQKDTKRGELYVLVISGNIIGSIVLSTLKDEEYNTVTWLTEDGNNYYIHRLAIHPKHQHKGYAKRLMDFAEQRAKDSGAVSVRLDTFSQNKRNQKFYKARGYQKLSSIYFPKQSEHPFYCYELVF
ncbi:GNAT family N-acetyltransferase [Marixanthomonas spongiae]|uniref:GNAT family N-acetyltransferase n=1 Tax=Marixanthomonas spongiae TaxID=2174845 RepID=A0A2U0I294_9FLAO|nr:GNAT family N-acetyltransferase [Marixanthomonas spongiae]PVW15229.1 GNAT family N-acetyltransferase [Marixanthomonas spongiae]